MVGWLAKNTQLFERRRPPEPPAPFELGCACGHQVSGMRQGVFQAVTCHRCGNVLFVLPSDVYPKPKPKKTAAKKVPPPGAPEPRLKAVQAVPVPTAPAKGSPGTQAAGIAAPHAAPPAPPAPSVRLESKPADPVTLAPRRPLISRFGLIVLAMGGAVTATGYFVWQSRLNDRALVSLPVHLEAGAQALRAGDLPAAAGEYRQAAWAVDRLGREDPESIGIRQKAKELNAIVNLSAVPLLDICEQARRAAKGDAEKWNEKFHELYRDSWIVVEGDVIQDSGPDGVGQAMVRFPFPIDSAPVVFDARLTALGRVSDKNGVKHVIFAGQLASLAKEGTKNPVWLIRLKDETAFLWADVDTYQALGLSVDAAGSPINVRQILSQQAEAIGLKP